MTSNAWLSPAKSWQPPGSVSASPASARSTTPSSQFSGSSLTDSRTHDVIEEEGGGRVGRAMSKRVRPSGGFLLHQSLPRRRNDKSSRSRDGNRDGDREREQGTEERRFRRERERDKGKAPSSSGGRLSTDSSSHPSRLSHETGLSPFSRDMGSSPLSRETDMSSSSREMNVSSSHEGQREGFAVMERITSRDARHASRMSQSQSSSLDPAQLVQMALSLSENRRRRVSTSLAVSAAGVDKERVTSAQSSLPAQPTLLSSPFPRYSDENADDRYREHQLGRSLHQDEIPTRRDDDKDSNNNNNNNNHFRFSIEQPINMQSHDPFYEPQVEYEFSAATVNRAERARHFFELASEYRRLLTHLPPLKPDAAAPGNFTIQTQPAPAGAAPQINRVRSNTHSKFELGREYNPLQLLRNRRLRHRQQRPLDPPPEAFDRVDKVHGYIDQVEKQSLSSGYRGLTDMVSLPTFRRGSTNSVASQDTQPATRGRKRADTSVSKSTKPIGDWSFNPSELFADALWLEQDSNKTLVENRHGNRIFPHAERQSLESRKSKESVRHSLERSNTLDSANFTADEGHRGRKKRNMLSLRTGKHLFRQRARSSSSSGASSAEHHNRPHHHGNDYSDDNVGPLNRHMRHLIEEEQSTANSSPADEKWDRGVDTAPNSHSSTLAHARTTSPRAEGFDLSPEDASRRFSLQVPTSPVDNTRFVPSMGMSLSPPGSPSHSPHRKPRPIITDNKESYNIQETDFATSNTSVDSLKQTNGGVELTSPNKQSFESIRPSVRKAHKSDSETQVRSDRRPSKDKAVSRFFKGGRIGDIVRAEGSSFSDVIWKKKAPKSAQTSHNSSETGSQSTEDDNNDGDDDDDDDYGPTKKAPRDASRTPLDGGDSKPKYHTAGLPTFKSQHASESSLPEQDDESQREKDLAVRQQRLRRGLSDDDHLDAPRIVVPDDELGDPPALRRAISATVATMTEGRRDSDHLLPIVPDPRKSRSASNSASSSVLSFSLPPSNPRRTSKTPASSRPSMRGKRQWSIGDARVAEEEEELQKVTAQDVARVRALYLTSGVKAQELLRQVNIIVNPPSEFLIAAGRIAHEKVKPVGAREEYLLAATLLSRTISASTEDLRIDLDRSRSERVPHLHSRFNDLKHQVQEKLMPIIQSTTDEAEAFNVELTTHQTLAVKQVSDAVDNILRARRRRLRMLRKAGFAILEWIVLGLLWIVWFVVVIIRFFRGTVMGTIRGVKWCLWL